MDYALMHFYILLLQICEVVYCKPNTYLSLINYCLLLMRRWFLCL